MSHAEYSDSSNLLNLNYIVSAIKYKKTLNNKHKMVI